jgi:hypothetical protein
MGALLRTTIWVICFTLPTVDRDWGTANEDAGRFSRLSEH